MPVIARHAGRSEARMICIGFIVWGGQVVTFRFNPGTAFSGRGSWPTVAIAVDSIQPRGATVSLFLQSTRRPSSEQRDRSGPGHGGYTDQVNGRARFTVRPFRL